MNELDLNLTTMSSSQLQELLNFESKSALHLALRNLFKQKIDDGEIKQSRDSRGYVEEYTIPKILAIEFIIKHKPSLLTDLLENINDIEVKVLFNLIENLDVSDLPSDRFVYVAKEEFSGRYKVGISKHPEERIKQLNVGNPEHLTLVHAYLATEEGNLSETLAHKLLSGSHIRSEWFDKNTDLNKLPSYKDSSILEC